MLHAMDTNYYQDWLVRKPVARGGGGVVASHSKAAAEAGAAVLRNGGNAIDAAVATSFAVSVVEPWMSGIGGVSFMMVYLAEENRVRCFNGGGIAPAALDPAHYTLVEGTGGDIFTWPAVEDDRNVRGYDSIATPGHVDNIGKAWERYGTMGWSDLLGPAVELAGRGLPVNWMTTIRVASAMKDIREYPESRRLYLPDGAVPVPEIGKPVPHLPMGNLQATLKRLAEAGYRDLYEGDIAAQIALDIDAGGGSLGAIDLAGYEALEVDALSRVYGGANVHAAPGMTAGPTLMDVLDQIEGQIGAGVPGPEAYAAYAKALAVAMEARFRDMGDIDDSQDPACTTHLTVIDGKGNMVSLTQTLLSVFGSKVVLPTTGIMMNNGMLWFDPVPDRPNSIAPGKRPLSNMCPVVVSREGAPWFALGASGGRRIMPAVMQIVSMMIDGGMDFEDAFHQPRIDVSGDGRATMDPRLGDAVGKAIEAHMPVFQEQRTVFPTAYANPNGVCKDGDGFAGIGEIMNPIGGAVAG
jgi:gamma-glutamyltranspeptidase/glutathione hydrolase